MNALAIALTGDSILQRPLMSRSDARVKPLFDLIRSADVAFTNLEVLPNDYFGDPAFESGGTHFGAPSRVLDDLVEAGFSLFAAATNHSLDYSISGLMRSIEELDARSLTYAGIGRNLDEARRPSYLTTESGTVALISCCSSYGVGHPASEQRTDMPGRPGLSALEIVTTLDIKSSQFEMLKALAEDLGLEQWRRRKIRLGFGRPTGSDDLLSFQGIMFKRSEEVRQRTSCEPTSATDILSWVTDAKGLADVVVCSIHSHEQGSSDEVPPEFFRPFAVKAIESGADIVVGHGPHLLRGMEMYRGRPIFYSLGNFIGQNELIAKLPSDSYRRYSLDPKMKTGAACRARNENDTKGFPADSRYWETVVPICRTGGNKTLGIDIYPVTLDVTLPRHVRGRPRLAYGVEGCSILNRFLEMSSGVDAVISANGASASVIL